MYSRLYEGFNIRLRSLAGGRWASYCRPTWIAFLLTELCNARCVHCDIWKNKGAEDAPTLEQWKAAVRDVRSWLGPVHVSFTGGEALLVRHTIDLVQYGGELGLFVELLTHGYWDDQSKIERLALARPWRVTVSLDGIGDTHTRIRGRDRFFEKTTTTLATLRRMRKEHRLDFEILLKTVVMEQNVDDLCELARFARQNEMKIFYQPIEQNYNTPENPKWFETSPNWVKSTQRAITAVENLIQMKKQGFPIINSLHQLQVMIPYLQNPDSLRVTTQGHVAHENWPLCAALGFLQIHANGDVRVCSGAETVGNIKSATLPEIWRNRPPLWKHGCCLERRCSPAEKAVLDMPLVSEIRSEQFSSH